MEKQVSLNGKTGTLNIFEVGFELDKVDSNGILVAQFVFEEKNYTIETNGDKHERYLEVVEHSSEEFSDPIYEVPKNESEVIDLLKGFIA